ncbi:N-acetylmuramoyl-L-alanine amidase A [Poriferisphaera corsica]|uniref:N-acetylmuramoyl-L-alanine amidase n=1 Tax=Poriferisphaera corsica TaxID=2528020 RepID=A0A517YPN4_9BACT|nr:peptidoglycan recognition family protein [Poriferisphaera corsica]QDU32187.1 N-acetylmuramoyl-L-alanine amidase A [Poriferisphaera corsica]
MLNITSYLSCVIIAILLTTSFITTTSQAAVSYPSGVVWDQAHTSNFSTGRSGGVLDLVVIHTTEGSYSSAVSWFNNPAANVSAHYVIDQDGSATQMVDSWNTAWTQTYVNSRALSFEMAGYANDPNTWVYCDHDAEYVAGAKNYKPNLYKLANIVAYFIEKTSGNGITYNIPNQHPTDVGYYYASNGPRLPSSVKGIVGHDQVQADQKTDPGQYFPWDDFMGMVDDYLDGTLPVFPSVPEPSAMLLLGFGSLGLLSRKRR